MRPDPVRPAGRHRPLEDVEREDDIAGAGPQDPAHVGRAGTLAADREDIDAVQARDEPAAGQRAQQVSGDGGDREGNHNCTNLACLMAGLFLISRRACSLGSVSTRTTM